MPTLYEVNDKRIDYFRYYADLLYPVFSYKYLLRNYKYFSIN